MKILLVEDDCRIASALAEALSDQNYAVDLAADGQTGWDLLKAFDYSLILLDVMLPRLNGLTFCQRLRSEGYQIPVLMLTARDTSADKVLGLDAGADDYVVKPFDLKELLARIRALLRRGNASLPPVLIWQALQVWGGSLALLLAGVGSWWLMRQSLQPIQQSFQQLQQFTADASHELRHPLTGIKASVEVMQSHPERIHPADLSKLAAIAGAANDMTALVEDLLLLARSEDSLAAAPTAIPLDELLEDLAELFLPQAVAKQLQFKHQLTSAWVKADPAQIKRLFTNLLANALAYTASGSITLSSTLEDDWIIVRVTDTGIGIAPDDLPHIFDRFWRADQARCRRAGGTGLGLAIAQTIVQSHRGKILVSSQLGGGSQFQVELPVA